MKDAGDGGGPKESPQRKLRGSVKRYPAAWVVAGWGAWNGVLLAVLGVYGESGLVFWLWGGVVAGLELAALVVVLSSRRDPGRLSRLRAPVTGGAAALPAALAAGITALGFVYGFWLLSLSVPLLAVSVALAFAGAAAGKDGGS